MGNYVRLLILALILVSAPAAVVAQTSTPTETSTSTPTRTPTRTQTPTITATPQVDRKLNANKYNVKLVQAFEACDTGGPSVTLLPGGLLGCPGGELDGTPFNSGKVIVKSKVFPVNRSSIIFFLKSSGTQAHRDSGTPPLAGKNVALRLGLRISQTATSFFGGTQYTFEDVEVTCPPIAVPLNGNVIQKTNLATDCELSNSMLLPASATRNDTNKEILGAVIIDADTQLAIAVPGVRKR